MTQLPALPRPREPPDPPPKPPDPPNAPSILPNFAYIEPHPHVALYIQHYVSHPNSRRPLSRHTMYCRPLNQRHPLKSRRPSPIVAGSRRYITSDHLLYSRSRHRAFYYMTRSNNMQSNESSNELSTNNVKRNCTKPASYTNISRPTHNNESSNITRNSTSTLPNNTQFDDKYHNNTASTQILTNNPAPPRINTDTTPPIDNNIAFLSSQEYCHPCTQAAIDNTIPSSRTSTTISKTFKWPNLVKFRYIYLLPIFILVLFANMNMSLGLAVTIDVPSESHTKSPRDNCRF